MNTRIYVENLPATTSAADLRKLFSTYGNVVDVNLTFGHDHHNPIGFGFVTMVTPEGARAAIQVLHGKQIATQTIMVSETRGPIVVSADTHTPRF